MNIHHKENSINLGFVSNIITGACLLRTCVHPNEVSLCVHQTVFEDISTETTLYIFPSNVCLTPYVTTELGIVYSLHYDI